MNELIAELVKQLGITDAQAKGGAGLLFKAAMEKLGSADAAKLEAALSGIKDLIGAAPKAGGAAKLLGGFASAIGGKAGGAADLASLVAGFSQLKLDKALIVKFIPIILAFVQGKGGDIAKQLLLKALPAQG